MLLCFAWFLPTVISLYSQANDSNCWLHIFLKATSTFDVEFLAITKVESLSSHLMIVLVTTSGICLLLAFASLVGVVLIPFFPLTLWEFFLISQVINLLDVSIIL